jgi:hypothetical protein
VNKVAGNIHLSPGKSFQSSSRNVYELVPYLRNDGNRHDFSHYINQFSFLGDDEYDLTKAKYGNEMKQKLGLNSNPLDGTVARVSIPWLSFSFDFCLIEFATDRKSSVYVPVFPESGLDTVADTGWQSGTSPPIFNKFFLIP